MKATITGNDTLSKHILADLQGGLRVSDVPAKYPVSLDQAKKLSQYRKILKAAKENLTQNEYECLKKLGIRSLPLAKFVKEGDWPGLNEILSVITEDTTRDEIKYLIDGLYDKRQRVVELKEHADLTLKELETEEKELQLKEKMLLQQKKTITNILKAFKQLPKPEYLFLCDSLGLYEGELVLAKQIQGEWYKELILEGGIIFDKRGLHFVKDVLGFVESLKNRYSQGIKYSLDTNKNNGISGNYNLSLVEQLKQIDSELLEIMSRKEIIAADIKQFKTKTLGSYLNIVNKEDFLISEDLKHHNRLVDKALRWLLERDFVSVAGFTLPNGYKVDIFAYNESQIIIIDVKITKGDLVTDKKWGNYLPYCHEFYLLSPSELISEVEDSIKEIGCGQCVETDEGIRVYKTDDRMVGYIERQEEMKLVAGRLLSRKVVYGY